MIKITDVYWVAGLLEGEGCFRFGKYPLIVLSMTDLDVVDKLRGIVSPDSRVVETCERRENRQIQYRIDFRGPLAIQWMMTIYPIMGIRRKAKIREIVERWKRMPGKGSSIRMRNIVRNIMRFKRVDKEEANRILKEVLDDNEEETIN